MIRKWPRPVLRRGTFLGLHSGKPIKAFVKGISPSMWWLGIFMTEGYGHYWPSCRSNVFVYQDLASYGVRRGVLQGCHSRMGKCCQLFSIWATALGYFNGDRECGRFSGPFPLWSVGQFCLLHCWICPINFTSPGNGQKDIIEFFRLWPKMVMGLSWAPWRSGAGKRTPWPQCQWGGHQVWFFPSPSKLRGRQGPTVSPSHMYLWDCTILMHWCWTSKSPWGPRFLGWNHCLANFWWT